MRRIRLEFALPLILACAFAGGVTVHAQPASDTSIQPFVDGPVEGASLAEWTARWWRWAEASPIEPYLDPDGRLCESGQDGPVWFLAGTDGQFEPKRVCVIPEGKYLLLPVINMIQWQRTDVRKRSTCAELQAGTTVNNDHLVSAVVMLDGKPLGDIRRHRVRSNGCFPMNPEDRLSALAAADGYWLMLRPLSRGRHTLAVGANYHSPGEAYGEMHQNFEYELDVGGSTSLGMQ